jgi:hypothetical protein
MPAVTKAERTDEHSATAAMYMCNPTTPYRQNKRGEQGAPRHKPYPPRNSRRAVDAPAVAAELGKHAERVHIHERRARAAALRLADVLSRSNLGTGARSPLAARTSVGRGGRGATGAGAGGAVRAGIAGMGWGERARRRPDDGQQ